MNVKKYRAATMRDALEQVKSELGDEALVLGSKSLKRRGFLGFGARDMVEVRVSLEFTNANSKEKSKPTTNRRKNFTSLSLNESKPNTTTLRETRNNNAFSALAARAYATEATEAKPNTFSLPPASLRATVPVAVAAATTAKQVVEETAAPPVVVAETTSTEKIDTQAPKRDSLMAELDRLRAEVREVKFTLTNNSRQHLEDLKGMHSVASFGEGEGELYDSPFYETYLHLANLGLSPEISRTAVRSAIASGVETRNVHELARIGLVNTLPSLITFGDDPLAPRNSSATNQSVVALVGPTGVGKTTTIAKLAARAALRERKRVELITLDTYRIAAVEQLRTYAEIIGAGFHVPRSVLELDALVQRFSKEATVLIDTIGRSARDLADQLELADYLRNNEQIVKCLAIQATTHPSDASLAIDKFALFGVNELVITKLDETGRSGAAICTAAAARLPLAYLCTGQRVPEDIEKATAQSLVAHALQPMAAAKAA
jgi:flagellar biosynthesis protein FlhF